MTKEEFVTAIQELRRKNEIEEYVEEVLEDMTEMELTGPSAESLEGKQLNYGVNVG
jgi:pilus assembly protein TadC